MNTDQLVRTRLEDLADCIKTTPPSLDALLDRAPSPVTPIGHARSRRRLVAAVIGATIVAVGGVAAATGVFAPEQVTDRFDTNESSVGAVAVDQAEIRATHTSTWGLTYELWEAPTSSGGTCRTVVESGDTTPTDQWASVCTTGAPASTLLAGYQTFVVDDRVAIHGGAPKAETVVILFDDGTELIAVVDDGEFFTVTEQTCAVESNRCPIATISTFDSGGNKVDEVDGPS